MHITLNALSHSTSRNRVIWTVPDLKLHRVIAFSYLLFSPRCNLLLTFSQSFQSCSKCDTHLYFMNWFISCNLFTCISYRISCFVVFFSRASLLLTLLSLSLFHTHVNTSRHAHTHTTCHCFTQTRKHKQARTHTHTRIFIYHSTFCVFYKLLFPFRTALFWVSTQRVVVISYRSWGTNYLSHLQGLRIQTNPCRWDR